MDNVISNLSDLVLVQTPAGIAVVEGEALRFRFTNAAYRKMTQLDRDVTGETFESVFPDAQPDLAARLRGVLHTRETGTLHRFKTYAVTTPEGGPTYWDAKCSPLDADGDGQADSVVMMLQNVTEHVQLRQALEERARAEAQARQALAESEARFRAAQEVSLDGFSIFRAIRDESGKVVDFGWVYSNPTALRTNRVTQEEIARKTLLQVLPGTKAAGLLDALVHVLETGEPADFEHPYEADRIRGWFRQLMVRVNADLVAATFIDITARRTAEEAVRELNETLEERVRSETEERRQAQDQLLQAQRIESLGQLTGGVAHDFNNILAATITSLELALRRSVDPQVARLVESALRSAQRGAKLVDQLLTFARRQRLETRPFAPGALIRSISDLLDRAIGPTIELALAFADDLWPVQTDPSQFENAVLNLAVNARDAMPDGGKLAITAENMAAGDHRLPSDLDNRDYVRICVCDTGTGMSEEVAARAFEPFFTTKPVGYGTGLGLSQVYGFAKQAGGTTTLTSHSGEGSQVCIFLPRTAQSVTDTRGDAPSLPRMTAPARPVSGSHVLVVDDDDAVRDAMSEMLGDLGMHVTNTGSPARGLDILSRTPPVDAVVVDFAMPEMNGLDFIRQARHRRPDLPCLLVTGYIGDSKAKTDLIGGRFASLRKPFDTKALSAALDRILAG